MRHRLIEGRDAPLYHSTGVSSAYKILTSNTLKASNADDLTTSSVSFSRSRTVTYGPIIFKFNQSKLQTRYKISPIAHGGNTLDGYKGDSYEERVVKDITNVRNYIEEIDVSNMMHMRILRRSLYKASKNELINNTFKSTIKDLYPFYIFVTTNKLPIGKGLKELFNAIELKLNDGDDGEWVMKNTRLGKK